MLQFITGNKDKFKEAQLMLAPVQVEQINIDLHEIQELDPYKIIEHKLKQAFKYSKGEFIVEDGSIYLDCLGGKLPGPLIRWFYEGMGNEGLYKLTAKMKNNKAEGKTIIGYAKSPKKIIYFEGNIKGKIVKPRKGSGFGYDPIFMPAGSKKVFAELKYSDHKFDQNAVKLTPRGIAIEKLKSYILK